MVNNDMYKKIKNFKNLKIKVLSFEISFYSHEKKQFA